MNKRRILLVDDHPVVRKGLAELIAPQPDLELCGAAVDVDGGLEQVRLLRPDLVVVDISLKSGHGIDLIGRLKDLYPDVKMLVWSMFDEKLFAERALRAGAMGYINKQQAIEMVLDGIRQVLEGQMYLSSQMTNLFLRRVASCELLEENPINRLSDRELAIFEMIGKGMTAQRIARELKLSPKTVQSHREHIKTKLGVNNGAELSQRAVQWVLENG